MNFCLTQGEVVALDRIRNKIDRIRQNAQMLHLRSIKAYCFNSTQAVSSDAAHETEGRELPMNIYLRLIPGLSRQRALLFLFTFQDLPSLLRVLTGFCWMLPVVASDRDPTWPAPGASRRFVPTSLCSASYFMLYVLPHPGTALLTYLISFCNHRSEMITQSGQ